MIPYTRHLYLDGVLVYPVLGPLSGTGVDNELVRWNGTDYHHIQSCPGVGVDDSGQMYIGSGASSPCSRLELWDDSVHPILSITAAHATDYDPQVQYRTDVTDTVKCSMGIDASDDSLRINMGVGVGGATHFVMDTNGGVKWQNSTDSTTSYQWFDADGGTPIMNIDTTNERVGISETAPSYKLEVNGTIHSTGNFTTDARIGIGITPGYPLHITNSSDNIILAYLIGTSTTPASSAILDLRQQSAADSTAMCRFRNDADYWSFGISGDDSFIISDSFADTLSSPRLVILQSGNVGISETAPSYKLEVNGTIHSTGNFTTDARIGIGITPDYPLHITNSSDNIILAYLIGTSTTPASSAILDLRQQSAADSTAMCRFRNDADYWSFGISGDDSFIISDSFADTLSSPRLVILQNGNVGISETAPETLIEFTHASPFMTFHCDTESDADESGLSKIIFKREQSDGTESTCVGIYAGHDGAGADQNGYIALYTNDGTDGDSPTEAMRIDSLRNVGIGTSTPDPDYKLNLNNGGLRSEGVFTDISATKNINYFYPTIKNTVSNANLIRGVHNTVYYSAASTANHTGTIRAISGEAYNLSSKTITYLQGLTFTLGILTNPGAVTNATNLRVNFYSTNGTITHAKNIEIVSPVGGTITNLYGLYIDDMSAGTTLNYAIYSAGGPSYFAGNVGIGVTDPDAQVEIFGTSTQFKLSYDATNYATIATGANGDTTITTVDADGADGDIIFNPDGYVGVGETSPDGQLHQTITSASDIGHIIELAASQTGNAFEVNTNGATGGDLIKFTSGGKIQTTAGFRAVSKEFSDAFVSWKYGGDTAEHSGQTGSYDHTGGTYERLFTATVAVFSQDDEDNHTWIVINSGTYKGAKAEIETYIDTTNVVVRGMGWDGDISSSTFSIVPHPLFIAGDGCNLAGCIGNQGNLHVRSKGFIGVADTDIMMEFIGDFGADDKTCFCIDVDANGYNHSDALCIGYKTGDLQPGDFAHGIHVSVDDTEATSADSTTEIDCLTFETANASSIEQHAIHVGVGFDIALLVSGAAAVDPDYGYEVASGSVVDRVNSGGAGDDAFVNSGTNQQILDADNDYILIGDDDTFEVLQVILATPGNQPAELEFYYSKAGGNWTQFYPSDGTNGFTRSGLISISAPGDWTEDDEAEANGDITEGYYWKIKRTRNNLVTPPTESYFKIFSSIDAGMQIRGDGTIKPASLADASAANDSIYYSTTQSKLVYKDSGGSVNDLY